MIIDPDQSPSTNFARNSRKLGRLAVRGTVFIDGEFLNEMGMYDLIEERFTAAGWPSFMTLESATNVEDTREFLASLLVSEDEQRLMRYRHRGTYYRASWDELARAFGCSVPDPDDLDTHTNVEAWTDMATGRRYESGRSIGKALREPWMFYLQRLVSHSIVGRYNGSQRPAIRDMEVLRGLYYGCPVDFASVMVRYWANISTDGDIAVGGLVTHYLRRMHYSPDEPEHTIVPAAFLTREVMRSYTGVTIRQDGVCYWSYRREFPVPPQAEQPQAEFRQARRRQPRRAAAPADEPPRSDRVLRPHRAQTSQPSDAELEYDFMVARMATAWGVQMGVERVRPPPGWRRGDPVPPEYQIPYQSQWPGMAGCTSQEQPPESSRAAAERARASGQASPSPGDDDIDLDDIDFTF